MCPRAASQSHWCGYRLWAYFMLSERKLDFCISSWLWFLGFGKSSTWHETLANDEVTSKREEFLLAVESAHLLVRAWFNGENSCNLWSISNILFAHTGTSQNVGVNTSRLHVCQAHYCVCVCVWCTSLSSHCQNASQTPRALCPGVTNRWKGVFEMTSRGKSDRGSHHGERALLGLRFLMSSEPVDLVGGAQQSDTAKQRDRRKVCKGFAYCSFSQLHRCFSETSFIKVILWICWNLFSPPLSQDSRVSVLRLLLWCLWKTGCSKWCKPLYTN